MMQCGQCRVNILNNDGGKMKFVLVKYKTHGFFFASGPLTESAAIVKATEKATHDPKAEIYMVEATHKVTCCERVHFEQL